MHTKRHHLESFFFLRKLVIEIWLWNSLHHGPVPWQKNGNFKKIQGVRSWCMGRSAPRSLNVTKQKQNARAIILTLVSHGQMFWEKFIMSRNYLYTWAKVRREEDKHVRDIRNICMDIKNIYKDIISWNYEIYVSQQTFPPYFQTPRVLLQHRH